MRRINRDHEPIWYVEMEDLPRPRRGPMRWRCLYGPYPRALAEQVMDEYRYPPQTLWRVTQYAYPLARTA